MIRTVEAGSSLPDSQTGHCRLVLRTACRTTHQPRQRVEPSQAVPLPRKQDPGSSPSHQFTWTQHAPDQFCKAGDLDLLRPRMRPWSFRGRWDHETTLLVRSRILSGYPGGGLFRTLQGPNHPKPHRTQYIQQSEELALTNLRSLRLLPHAAQRWSLLPIPCQFSACPFPWTEASVSEPLCVERSWADLAWCPWLWYGPIRI